MLSYALTYSNLLSPTSQRLAVRPFSPERETYCILHVYKAFAFSSFYRIPSALPLQSFEDCTVTHTVYIMYEYIVRSGRIVPNKKRHRFRCLFLFSNSTASRNFNMGILRIPFLCGLRLAKTILCLRASPGQTTDPAVFIMEILWISESYGLTARHNKTLLYRQVFRRLCA